MTNYIVNDEENVEIRSFSIIFHTFSGKFKLLLYLGFPRQILAEKQPKLVSGTLSKVKFPKFPCKVVEKSYKNLNQIIKDANNKK